MGGLRTVRDMNATKIYPVTLLLDCGHKLHVKLPPLNSLRGSLRVKYACRCCHAGGYGNRQDWVQCADERGVVWDNTVMDRVAPDYPPRWGVRA